MQKVLTPDKRSAIKDYKSFCMLAFLLIYTIRYQSLQEMNTLSSFITSMLYVLICMLLHGSNATDWIWRPNG